MDTGLGSFGLFWGPVSESGVDPPPVIVALDIREEVSSGILSGWPSPLVGEFDLQRVEEAFHGRIVVAAGRAAHWRLGFHGSELPAVRLGCAQGGLNRSSQHPDAGGCDEHSKAAVGAIWTGTLTFTRTAACSGA